MDSEQVFAVEVVGFLVLFSLVALWYWWPGLLRLGTVEALTPLLLLHVARTVGLTVLVAGVTDLASHDPSQSRWPTGILRRRCWRC